MHKPSLSLLLVALGACAGGATPTQAPTPAAPRGVASITTEDVRRRIFLVADDSMSGRGTPSVALDRMATYVAGEFQRFGLRPGGDSGTFFQRYPLEVYQAMPESSGVWATGGAPRRWAFGTEARYVQGKAGSDHMMSEPTLVTGTPQQGVALDSAAVSGRVAIVPIGPAGFAGALPLLQLKPAAIVAILNLPDSIFAMMPDALSGRAVVNPEEQGGLQVPPVIVMRDAAAKDWLAQLGVNLDSARASAGALSARVLPGTTVHLLLKRTLLERTAAPNVIGVLEGSDPALKNEYLIYTAHMDHIGTATGGQGCAARGADTICNGADDDGSGSVAVLELAQAFASAPERPKRSIIFMTVSGEERGLWGSGHFAAHPTVPLGQIVADLNTDMVGRSDSLKDSMAVIGREHSDLGATLDRVAAAHPELRMTPINDPWPQENLFARSDHYNFAVKGVPVLFFTSGLHNDYHGAGDTPDKIDWDKEARYARLAYFLGMEIANAPARPQWNPDSYKKIVQQGGN